MKRILFIAYLFPPHGGGGVQRAAKFVKYLPSFGWQPTVLTTTASRRITDPSLARDVGTDLDILRVRGLALPDMLPWRIRHWLTRWLLTVDAEVGWLPFAVRQGARALAQKEYSAILSTSTPYTDHLVARRLKRDTGLPWVADFRDPWIENYSADFATRWHRAACSRLEGSVVHEADRVLVVSEPMAEQFRCRYPGLPSSHFVTIPNGYDSEDYKGLEAAVVKPYRFQLVYTGTLYGRRSARPLLVALHGVLEEGRIAREEILIRLIGAAGPEAYELVAKWHLQNVVEFCGYRPHGKMLAEQLAADMLLLIIAPGPGSEIVLTGKIFEYLAARRPILALVPPGAARNLLETVGVGTVVPPDDIAAIADALVGAVERWRRGKLEATPDEDVLRKYERRHQTSRLATILDEVSIDRQAR